MSVFGRIMGWFRALSLTDAKAWNRSLWNLYGSQSLSGEVVTEETALYSSSIYNAVSLISGTIGSLPCHLMQRKGEKKRLADDRKLYRVMHDEWNPYMTAMAGRETMMAHILLWGNGFAEIVRNGYGEAIELWPIPPDKVRIDAGPAGLVYRVRTDSGEVAIPRENVLHVPGLGYDGYIGYSVVAMARKSLGLTMALETFGAMYFGQGTHPGVIVSHPTKLSAQANDNLKKSLTEGYSGLGKSHRLLLLEEGMKIEKIGIPPEDSQFLECVVPQTPISMADGTRKLASNIVVGDAVLAWKNGQIAVAAVSATGKPPRKNLVRIRTARGRELIASEDHPCLAIDHLRTPGCRVPKNDASRWTPMRDLRVGSYVRVGLDAPVTATKHELSFDVSYFLGAMAGDGYIRRSACSFTNNDDGVVARMGTILQGMGGDLRKQGGPYNYAIITNGLGCKGSAVRSLLKESGLVGEHSHTKRVPKIVLRGGIDAWKGFLSGYFDTDGSIRPCVGKQKPALYWSSTSREMLDECQHMLAMLGIQSSIYLMSAAGRKTINGVECAARSSWGLYVMGVTPLLGACKLLDSAHRRKASRLKQYSESLGETRYREENFQYDRVVSIEELGEGETVGIEVGDCHTHITAGLVTHNTRQFQIPEVARWFNLPPHKLKDLTRSSFSNIESEQISFVQDSILPWLVRLEQNYQMQLLSPSDKELSGRGRLYFKHIVEGLLRGDAAARATFYREMFAIGAMSVNEIRGKEDMDPVEGGDIRLVPMNMTTLENAGKPQEAPAIPALPPGNTQDDEGGNARRATR